MRTEERLGLRKFSPFFNSFPITGEEEERENTRKRKGEGKKKAHAKLNQFRGLLHESVGA